MLKRLLLELLYPNNPHMDPGEGKLGTDEGKLEAMVLEQKGMLIGLDL